MLTALLAGAFVVVAQAAPGSSVVTPPQEVHVTNTTVVQVPPPDPKATAEMAGWSFEGIFINVIAPTLVKWTNDLLDMPDFVRTTPPDWTYNNPGVRTLSETVRTAALALAVIVFIAWGFAKMAGQQPPFERPFAATALAGGNLIWWRIGIDALNALNGAIAPPNLASIVRPHLNVPQITSDPLEAFGPALLTIAYCVVVVLLIFSQFFRLCFIDMLIVVGSLALMCFGVEQARGFYDKYVGLATGTLFSQVLVVVALRLSPILGVIGGTVTGALLGLGVLLLARKMPGLLASSQQRSGGMGGVSLFLLLRRVVARV